ncbi:MAG: histidine kinase dimerization/phospho-acceptor domain-containing protein [Chromatiaceae bacterium]
MSRPRFWHRVRFKLLLVSFTLLGIPWAGYRFIQETEHFLRDAQDQALQTTANSVANIMHGYEGLFPDVARPGSVLTYRNLFLHPLEKAPQLDGYRDEWVQHENNFIVLRSIDDRLEARILLGRHGPHLYLLLGVKDPAVRYGEGGDAVDLALIDQDGKLRHYRIQPEAPGWVVARNLREAESPADERPGERPIRGEWQNHADGYTLELRMPRAILRDRLSLRFFDSQSGQVLASGRLYPAAALGRIVEPATQLDDILADVTPPATRVWVTDHQGLVLAKAGRLDVDAPLSADQPRMPWFVQELILAVLPRDADAVADLSDDQTHLFIAPVVEALSGRPASLRRQPQRGKAVVVSAAAPIRSSEGVRGAVLVEQTTNAILSAQNLALQRLFGVTLVFFAVTSLGLLTFASLLASRIIRLRDKVETAVSHDGRIIGGMQAESSHDEIGDLSRSFASVLERLHEYTHYLEAMASRLTHELRMPLAVVRGSLEHASQCSDDEQAEYLDQARQGTERLEKILVRLREATELEQALRQAEPTTFDLIGLLRLQTGELRDLHPTVDLQLQSADSELMLHGVPDLMAKAIKELVDNAVDFRQPGSPVLIQCLRDAEDVLLSVVNIGPPLPVDVDVFQSMYSERSGRQAEPHLGLGLYLVRLIGDFHGGSATAVNVEDAAQVRVTMRLPST